MIAFLGGIGLFLLGMRMMTDGLTTAAGHTLRQVLGSWTATPARGLLAGGVFTAVIQSSAAVTIATLGFVNAGLLPFERAMWIVFGANVGTTLTAWIVAAVGMDLDIAAAALPAIGIGMLATAMFPNTRRAGVGSAMAGLGVFFLGLEVLSTAFGGAVNDVDLGLFAPNTFGSGLVALLGGLVLTVLVQSSTATTALAITAAAGGALSVADGALLVVGANVGSTSPAILGAIGASPSARRLAGSHVLFNGITAVAALVLLPVMLWVVRLILEGAGRGSDAAITLALFHTLLNVLGVVLMVPLSPHLAAFLRERMPDPAERAAVVSNLDRSVLAVPDLAVQALIRETLSLAVVGVDGARQAFRGASYADTAALHAAHQRAVSDFAVEIQRGALPVELVDRVLAVVETAHRLRAVFTDAEAAAAMRADLPSGVAAMEPVMELAAVALDLGTPADPRLDPAEHDRLATEVERRFRLARTELVRQAAQGALDPEAASSAITYLGLMRRAARSISDVVAILHPLYEQARLVAEPTPGPHDPPPPTAPPPPAPAAEPAPAASP